TTPAYAEPKQAKPSNAEQLQRQAANDVPHCARKSGTISIVDGDDPYGWTQYNPAPPQKSSKVIVQRSGCFNSVDRGGKISAADLQVVGDVIEVASKPAAPQRESTGEKATGTVKFFNAMKGFGFITRDDGQPDAFVHISAVERSGMRESNEGDKSEFDLEVDRRGKYSAVNSVPRQD
ncbi:hypothetical protein OY671_009779, partial [Metschnikowia pulcherrima]